MCVYILGINTRHANRIFSALY